MKWLCLLWLLSVAELAGAAQEFRGIWVDAFGPGFRNKEQVTQLVEDCRKYNFNAVFVQMRRRGDAFYLPTDPEKDVRTTVLSPGFDALAEVIKQCHADEPRIEVHCWVVSHFVWAYHKPPPQPNHVFNKHPEWLTRDSLGQKILGNGSYLDPGNPEANQWLKEIALDIIKRYDVDGFHWDYARYPVQDSGYNATALARYNAEFGSKGEPEPNDRRFIEWRQRQLTDFLRDVNSQLWRIKPKLNISIAVFSSYSDSANHRMADWVKWLKEKICDVAIIMDFSPENKLIFEPRADFALTNQAERHVYVGQGAYMNKVENTIKQLQYCRDKGFKGTVLYSYRNPAPFKSISTKTKQEGIVIDNQQAKITGDWETGEFGRPHDGDYLFKFKGTGDSYVDFKADIPEAGRYSVYEWHVAGTNRATAVTIDIVQGGTTNSCRIDQRKNGASWNHLGVFSFKTGPASLRVFDNIKDESRVIVADAFRIVRAENDDVAGDSSEDQVAVPEKEKMHHQARVFSRIKDLHQPSWQQPPPLPWKANQ